jgi:hypothetical protein
LGFRIRVKFQNPRFKIQGNFKFQNSRARSWASGFRDASWETVETVEGAVFAITPLKRCANKELGSGCILLGSLSLVVNDFQPPEKAARLRQATG